ncbi:hypothetical protein Q7346_11045, partial [Glaesserella parasuis]|nr:hypothetical protein [Glaesserella parasuis]
QALTQSHIRSDAGYLALPQDGEKVAPYLLTVVMNTLEDCITSLTLIRIYQNTTFKNLMTDSINVN